MRRRRAEQRVDVLRRRLAHRADTSQDPPIATACTRIGGSTRVKARPTRRAATRTPRGARPSAGGRSPAGSGRPPRHGLLQDGGVGGRHHAIAVAPDRRHGHREARRLLGQSDRERRGDRAVQPACLAAAVDEAARGLVVHGRRIVDERAECGAAQRTDVQEPALPVERRSSQRPVHGHELQRAVLPGRGGLEPLGPTTITRATTRGA